MFGFVCIESYFGFCLAGSKNNKNLLWAISTRYIKCDQIRSYDEKYCQLAL